MVLLHPAVAKNVDVMTSQTPITFNVKLEAPNRLWLIPASDRATTDPQLKFTKLE